MSLPGWVEQALADLDAIGVGVWGIAAGAPWQAVLPGCRSVLVVGNGGTRLWEHAVAEGPRPDPVDGLVRRVVDRQPQAPGRNWVRCAADAVLQPDFRQLGLDAGLGWSSRLGLLLHPTHGPWLGLRAACFTTEALPIHGPLLAPAPCADCAAPCATACPAQALAPSWRADRCLPWRSRTTDCTSACHARSACVVGTASAYSALQHRYHQHPEGREAVLASLSPTAGDGTGRAW